MDLSLPPHFLGVCKYWLFELHSNRLLIKGFKGIGGCNSLMLKKVNHFLNYYVLNLHLIN